MHNAVSYYSARDYNQHQLGIRSLRDRDNYRASILCQWKSCEPGDKGRMAQERDCHQPLAINCKLAIAQSSMLGSMEVDCSSATICLSSS